MGLQAGHRGKGRIKGSVNRKTEELNEKLSRMGCDHVAGLAIIANNDLPCGVCRGTLRTKYKLPEGQHASNCEYTESHYEAGVYGKTLTPGSPCSCNGIGTRTCESCYGDGFEACSPELRANVMMSLMKYTHCPRKAIEISGEIGTPDLAAILRERFKARSTARP